MHIRAATVIMAVSVFLENYWQRDQVCRVIQYGAQLLGGCTEWAGTAPRLSATSLKVFVAFGNMRVMTRLMDGLPALAGCLKSLNRLMAHMSCANVLGAVTALSFQMYYPAEHIAWLADNRLISQPSGKFWSASSLLWGVAILATLINNIITLLRNYRTVLQYRRMYAKSKKTDDANSLVDVKKLQQQNIAVTLLCIMNIADLFIAANGAFLEGQLWKHNRSLTNVFIGLCGTISSLIGLLRMIYPTSTYLNMQA